MKANADRSGKTEDQKVALQNQCSALRCRIRDNATAIISGKLTSLRKPHSPKTVQDPNDAVWKSLDQEQTLLMQKVDAIKKTTDLKSKNDIIRSVRKQYPKIAQYHSEPRDPAEKEVQKHVEKSASSFSNQPYSEPPQSYNSAVTSTARISQPYGLPSPNTFQQRSSNSVYPPYSMLPSTSSPTIKRTATGTVKPGIITQPGIKSEAEDLDRDDEEEDDDDEEAEDNEKQDGSYDPNIDANTTSTRSGKKLKRDRTGDFGAKLKRATTKEDLDYQLIELKFKYRLQEIAVKKKIAEIENKPLEKMELESEENDVHYAKNKAAVNRKMAELRKDQQKAGRKGDCA